MTDTPEPLPWHFHESAKILYVREGNLQFELGPVEQADAKLRKRVAGWQPIETAPKDGRDLLLWDEGPVLGFWRAGISGFYDCVGGDPADPEPFYPTHWHPLPEPPL